MGLLSLHLGLEKLKDRTIKSSTMSQVLCSTIVLEFFISFQNKIQRFHCMTLSCPSICGIFGSSLSKLSFICGICGSSPRRILLLPFLPRAFVEFIGRDKTRAYLQCIYCKVKQMIQRELSHTIKSRCACVWIYVVDIYIWWLT